MSSEMLWAMWPKNVYVAEDCPPSSGSLIDVLCFVTSLFYTIRVECVTPKWFNHLGVASEYFSTLGEPVCQTSYSMHWYTKVFLMFTLLVSCYVFYLWLCTWRTSVVGHDTSSWYINFLMKLVPQPRLRTCTLRSLFARSIRVANKSAANHTHADSARVRNDGASFMDVFAAQTGLPAYFLQKSAADDRHGRVGCRTFHWGKDLSAAYAPMIPPERAILCAVDVDMYLDMPKLLTDYFQPVLLSTFSPSSVAYSGPEYSFTFHSNDEVEYLVTGGASYRHMVWNYGSDVVMAVSRTWWGMHRYHVYNVDKRQTDEHHQLVLLSPIRRVNSWLIPLGGWLGSSRLRRLRVAEPIDDMVYTRLTVSPPGGLMRSTGIAGGFAHATIPAKHDDTIASLARVGDNHRLTPATIKQVLDNPSQEVATILTEYHRHKTGKTSDVVYPVAESVFRYQHDPKEYDPSAKPSMIPFMAPFVPAAYAPDRCKNNDRAAINGRVLEVKPPEDMAISPRMLVYMKEFAAKLVPEDQVGKGHPVDLTTVRDRQARPAQRMILDRAGDVAASVVDCPIQSFQKSEVYDKPADPRIISTIPGVSKLNYSRYVYAFSTLMRLTDWYAFALSPLKVATRVMEVCAKASTVVLTDLSRFDGRVSKVLRLLESTVMLRYFHPVYHRELTELMSSQKNQRAVTTFGIKYNTGDSRASGSAETADFNSFDNAFMAFATLREQGRDSEEAWKTLGIYGGDDGLTPDANPSIYVRVCAEVGQVLEIDERKRGEAGVTFLAREYGPDVWHGAMDSMCDVKRQISKLHATISLPSNVTPLRKLAEKLYAFYLTDRNTPIIGEIARAFVEGYPDLVPSQVGSLPGVAYYHALADESEQYPNRDTAAQWMEDSVRRSLPGFDRRKLREWLAAVVDSGFAEEFLSPPVMVSLEHTHDVKRAVVVNGDVVTPPPTPPAKPSVKEYTPSDLEKMAKRACTGFAAGKCKYGEKCRFSHAVPPKQ
jgi:hypothetical protein